MGELTNKQIDALILENMKLVTYIISRSFRKFIGTDYFEDIKQEGNIGLIKAAHDFKPSLGFKFSTYASCRIYGEAKRYIRDILRGNGIKMSRNILDMQGKILEITKSGDNLPSIIELAKMLGEDKQKIIECMQSMTPLTSIDQPISDETDDTLASLLVYTEDGYNNIEYAEFVEGIEKFIAKNYKGQQRDIIEDYFFNYIFFGKLFTQTEMANRYKISQAQICRILAEFKNRAIRERITNI